MAAIPKVTETNRLTGFKLGQINNNFVRASEYNRLVDRVNSLSTTDGELLALTLGNTSVSGTLGVSGATTLSSTLNVTGAAVLSSTLAVTGNTTISGSLLAKDTVVDTAGVFATPIVLTEAQSGSVILVDDAAGLDFTLPAVAAAQVGTKYTFLVSVTITSNSFRVTAAAGDLLRGGIFNADFNTANTGSYFTPDESDDLICTMNGSTQGGKKGTKVTFTAITATGWFVEGLVFGDGALATPFS